MITTQKTSEEYVTLYVDNQLFGIPVSKVQEILPPQPMTRIPHAPPSISGLLNLRGQIVTVIDLRSRLRLPPRSQIKDFMNIIVSEGEELFSLLADSVGDVLNMNKETFSASPSNMDPLWTQCSTGVFQLPEGLMLAIDISSIIQLSNNKQ